MGLGMHTLKRSLVRIQAHAHIPGQPKFIRAMK
jgi:hypothetical protein